MELSDTCLLSLYSGNTKVNNTWVTVTHGLPNPISCSERRENGLHKQISKLESLDVHVSCRKLYTEPKRIAAAQKCKATNLKGSSDESPTSRLRSTHPSTFNIKMDCMFSDESQASLISTLCGFGDKNNEHISVRLIDWKADSEKKALERNDELGL